MIRDTLLIIDDSELDLAILNEIFKNLFCVTCTSDARQGLTFLRHKFAPSCWTSVWSGVGPVLRYFINSRPTRQPLRCR